METTTLRIESKTVRFQLDTGAKVNVISDKIIQDPDIECHYEKTQVKLSHIQVIRSQLKE